MGRRPTGKTTISSINSLSIGYIRKNGGIVAGKRTEGSIEWANGSVISFESNLIADPYLRLAYSYDGIVKDYQVSLSSVPSNLCKGEIYYFICPVNDSRCRKLYWCYESGLLQSRTAFKERLYYYYQLSSEYNYHNDRYWSVERQLKVLYSKVVKSHYRGYPTRLQLRIERLEEKLERFNKLRWTKIPIAIQKMFDERKRVQ